MTCFRAQVDAAAERRKHQRHKHNHRRNKIACVLNTIASMMTVHRGSAEAAACRESTLISASHKLSSVKSVKIAIRQREMSRPTTQGLLSKLQPQ